MAELLEKSPCAGLLPKTINGIELREVETGPITAVLPYAGKTEATSKALQTAHGVAFPKPNQSNHSKEATCVWTGRDQAMLLGVAPDPALAQYAALVDQSDAWAIVDIDGKDAEAILARLVPIDLRVTAFGNGACARTLVQHMTASVQRMSDRVIRIMVFRSMATTLVHELETAATTYFARPDT